MELTQLANLGEFIGGVAVLVTLIYLALQVRHTRRQLDEQSLSTAFQILYEGWDPVFSRENRELLYDGLSQSRELDESEYFAFTLLLGRILGTSLGIERSGEATQKAMFPTVEFLLKDFPGGVAWAERARGIPAFGPSFEAFDRMAIRSAGEGS